MIEMKTFPRSILITDDHSIIRKTLREWLCEEFPELTVLEASSGEAALEILSGRERPELIVLDFHLPGLSGIEVTREIKSKYPDLPVLILTIQEDRVYIDRALEAGADSYVIKRQMYNELIPSIEKIYVKGGENVRC
jgi:DNA-binding NarL/FixJ family response regulator